MHHHGKLSCKGDNRLSFSDTWDKVFRPGFQSALFFGPQHRLSPLNE
jgi:hypothetical protein